MLTFFMHLVPGIFWGRGTSVSDPRSFPREERGGQGRGGGVEVVPQSGPRSGVPQSDPRSGVPPPQDGEARRGKGR